MASPGQIAVMASTSPAFSLADAAWLVHRYDPGQDAVHFLSVPRETHRRATFLTDEYLPQALQPLVVRRADAMAAMPTAAPLHFIFHSAYCCSTLLARAFDHPGLSMGLKEPVIFNDLTGWRRRREPGPDMASVVSDSLTLLARPFEPGEAVVVKPSTVANALAPAILTLRAEARAVLLYAPLPTFLASIAKKELTGRLWVRELFAGMLEDGLAQFGYSTRELLGQTDLQVAALAWLGQHALFADLVKRFPDRVRTLDSATLTARPRDALAALGRLYRLPINAAALDTMLAGPAFTRHSKFGQAFDTEAREAEHRAAETTHAGEIGVVLQWAERVAETMGIRLDAPAPLLG